MYPIVNIIYSIPALNTHLRQRALLANVNPIQAMHDSDANGETNDYLHYFALPNNLNRPTIVWLPMNETHS